MIEVTKKICISERELVFRFSRSAGPGGQNVNKVNTRVTLFFDVAACESFSDIEKKRILRRLATRADKKGVIRVVSQKYRSQGANRRTATERLIELLRGALQKAAVRKKTKLPESAKRRRLEDKRRRSLLKKQRAFSGSDGEAKNL